MTPAFFFSLEKAREGDRASPVLAARPPPALARRPRPVPPTHTLHQTQPNPTRPTQPNPTRPQAGKYFHLTERKSRFSREVRAGVVTFLTAWCARR